MAKDMVRTGAWVKIAGSTSTGNSTWVSLNGAYRQFAMQVTGLTATTSTVESIRLQGTLSTGGAALNLIQVTSTGAAVSSGAGGPVAWVRWNATGVSTAQTSAFTVYVGAV